MQIKSVGVSLDLMPFSTEYQNGIRQFIPSHTSTTAYSSLKYNPCPFSYAIHGWAARIITNHAFFPSLLVSLLFFPLVYRFFIFIQDIVHFSREHIKSRSRRQKRSIAGGGIATPKLNHWKFDESAKAPCTTDSHFKTFSYLMIKISK